MAPGRGHDHFWNDSERDNEDTHVVANLESLHKTETLAFCGATLAFRGSTLAAWGERERL